MEERLLTREDFKKQVFNKTHGKCCIGECGDNAVDAHHIMDRKLWTDGGYYLSNGAALCSVHHYMAEKSMITPKQCYLFMGIEHPKKPDTIDWLTQEEFEQCVENETINKWGE